MFFNVLFIHVLLYIRWKESRLEDASNIRAAAPKVNSNWRPSVDEHCECKAKSEINEPFGWWKCQVKSLNKNDVLCIGSEILILISSIFSNKTGLVFEDDIAEYSSSTIYVF